jgi:hypothetical protein
MRLLLASSVIITGLTAHLGGLFDRGVDFLHLLKSRRSQCQALASRLA